MKKERLLSLDVFRGLTIAAMILVNDPGSWTYVYAPLRHAQWHGCTPTDLIFPFFLFMVGLAISIGSPKTGEERKAMIGKILKRSLYLFLIGLFLNAYPNFDWQNLRIPGVLQRIGLVFLVIALMHHYATKTVQMWVAAGILIIYWALMSFVPVPGIGEPNLQPNTSLAAWFDRLFLSGHMWGITKTWDPEGLLSTLPAIVTGLLGMFVGRLLFKSEDKQKALIELFIMANLLIVAGLAWDMHFPINKSLWTSSFVLYTGGIAMNLFAVMYWLLDFRKYRSKVFFPMEVFGSNAITVYTFAGILANTIGLVSVDDQSLQGLIFSNLASFLGNQHLASLVYALTFVGICYIPIIILYRKNIFIKV